VLFPEEFGASAFMSLVGAETPVGHFLLPCVRFDTIGLKQVATMFFHQKELIQPVKVVKPDARFGTFLLEQFGGATGELTAALQYWVQSFHVENAGIRDMAAGHRDGGIQPPRDGW
jgi:Manganese containing catalase